MTSSPFGHAVTELFQQARRHRSRGDLGATISTYEELLAILPPHERHARAVASDNLGNALRDAGRAEEALRRYGEALDLEDAPADRMTILANRANAYVELGELRTAAAQLQAQTEELERAGMPPEARAIALDNTAAVVAGLGETRSAIELLDRAAGLLGPDTSAQARAVNALSRAQALLALGDERGAGAAFTEAHDLAFAWARTQVDVERYRAGFTATRATRAQGFDAEVMARFVAGLKARDDDQLQHALAAWSEGSRLAHERGDHALALRIDANAASLLADAGDVDQAAEICWQVARQASAGGYALPEAMAWGTLAALAGSGADIELPLGAIGALALSSILDDVQAQSVATAGLSAEEAAIEASDTGKIEADIAVQARRHYALELAVEHFEKALVRARAYDAPYELANRLGGLVDALDLLGRRNDSDRAADELEAVAARDDLPMLGAMVAQKVLGEHLASVDPAAAIGHLRRASDVIEAMRDRVPPGPRRTQALREGVRVHRLLSRLLRDADDPAAAFEALQRLKGRRLLDALTGSAGISDAAPTAAEVAERLAALARRTACPIALVDLVAEEDGLAAHIVTPDGVTAVMAPGDPARVEDVERGDVHERRRRLVDLCLNDTLLAALAQTVDDALPPGVSLLLVPDQYLHNLPLQAIPLRGTPWSDRRRIGHLAAAGALRLAGRPRAQTGRSLVAGDSSATLPLPHAAQECRDIAALLGCDPLVGPGNCTRDAVVRALKRGDHDVVHLAVHGRGDARRGDRASLLLGDGEWVAFDELAALPWRADLVVFSGCSTAVSGQRNQRDFLGVAQAAAEAGAEAVVACLWPVGDAAAAVFMRALYEWFTPRRRNGTVDLRAGLDVARGALRTWLRSAQSGAVHAHRRDGREVAPEIPDGGPASHEPSELSAVEAAEWAPFILLGDPILGA